MNWKELRDYLNGMPNSDLDWQDVTVHVNDEFFPIYGVVKMFDDNVLDNGSIVIDVTGELTKGDLLNED